MLTTAITAPTPMMMPSIVSAERILFRASARSASRNVFMKSMLCISRLARDDSTVRSRRLCRASFPGGHCLPHLRRLAPPPWEAFQHFARDRAILNDVVPAQFAVAKLQSPFRVLRDVRLVRDQHDGQALLVIQCLQNVHDLDRCPAVQVPGRLIGQQDRRPVHQPARNGHALLLPAGKLRRMMPGAFGESHARQRLHGPLGPLFGS